MTKLIQPALVAAVLVVGASSAMAHTSIRSSTPNETVYVPNSTWTDMSSPYGGYSPNSLEGQRAFWDYQSRRR
jgi:hypothetical protein